MRTFIKLLWVSLTLCVMISVSYSQNDPAAVSTKIRGAYDAFNNKQYDKFSDYMTDDFNDHSPFPGQKPGLAGVTDAFKMFFKAYPDAKFTVKDIIVNNDGTKASVLYEFTGTNSGDFMGMPATNKKVDIVGLDWLVFRGDKASEHWGYDDTQTMMQQLGLMK
jgi:steroid delta-isomerase-like uncharacterized protein